MSRSHRAVAALAVSMLMPSLDTSIANTLLPVFADAFDASFQQVQWIVLSYLLAITTLIVTAGRLGDMVGRRRLLLAGLALFTVASLSCGAATTLPILLLSRAAQGLGAAIMMALAVALVGDIVPAARTGSVIGLLGTMSAIGTTLGPSLGGVLMSTTGWRAIFLVNVPIGVIAFALAWRYLPADTGARPASRPRFDIAGTVTLALALGSYALAMTLGRGGFGLLNGALLAATAGGAALFVLVERRVPAPMLRVSLAREPVMRTALALSAIVSTVMMSTLVVGPFYLARGLGIDAVTVGFVLSIGPLVAAVSGVPAGRLVDRLGGDRLTVAGLAGILAAALLLAIIPMRIGVAGYIAPIVVMTASYALFQAANNTVVMTGVTGAERGVVAGVLSLSRNLGLITGASAMGALFTLATGSVDPATAAPEAIAVGMRTTFAAAAVLLAAAALARSRAGLAKVVGDDVKQLVCAAPVRHSTGVTRKELHR